MLVSILPSGVESACPALIDPDTGRISISDNEVLPEAAERYAHFEGEYFLLCEEGGQYMIESEDFGEFRAIING